MATKKPSKLSNAEIRKLAETLANAAKAEEKDDPAMGRTLADSALLLWAGLRVRGASGDML